jgi:predicted dehydrogenase
MSAIRVGVVGVGALGQHHARIYAELPDVRLAGVFDKDEARAREVAARHGVRVFASLAELASEVDAVSVAVPTLDHHAVAEALLNAGKDVLVEKPISSSLAEADALIGLARQRQALLQVGHVERFNPAYALLQRSITAPRFAEVHRLSAFSARSLDIDVVLDLMIHDLDLVLALNDAGAGGGEGSSQPVQVDAVGVPVLTSTVDIANARLRFASGLIANLTASRVSTERVRKFRVFAPRTYISADLAAREAQVYRLEGSAERPEIRMEQVKAPEQEPLRLQLEAFLQAVRVRGRVVVSGEDGRRALALALLVLERIRGTSGADSVNR